MLGEYVRGLEPKAQLLLSDATDMLHLDPEYDMGITGAMKLAHFCEMLGLDPLYVACEGRMVVFVPGEQASTAVDLLRATQGGEGAVRIGTVTAEGPGMVFLRTALGTKRILDLLSGEQLPRIC